MCAQIAKKQFPDEWAQRRVEFLPCEWRTWLTLDKGQQIPYTCIYIYTVHVYTYVQSETFKNFRGPNLCEFRVTANIHKVMEGAGHTIFTCIRFPVKFVLGTIIESDLHCGYGTVAALPPPPSQVW